MSSEKSSRPVTDKLKLPAHLIPARAKVTLCGSEVIIENHGGIMTYTGQCVEVRTKDGFLRINGDELRLAAMTLTEIIIWGLIVSVEQC